jgi:hypothetical protein
MVFGEQGTLALLHSECQKIISLHQVSIVKTTFERNDDIPDDEVGFKRLVLCSDCLLDHLVQLQ